MRTIKAPEGFEGCVCYSDGARSWQPAYRAVGETYWTNTVLVGHAHMTTEEVNTRAEASIARWIEAHKAR